MCLGWGLQGEEEGCRKKLVWFGQKVPLGFFHPIVCKNLNKLSGHPNRWEGALGVSPGTLRGSGLSPGIPQPWQNWLCVRVGGCPKGLHRGAG